MPESTKDPQQLGINSWMEEELYQTYLHDRKYVDESWKDVFEADGRPAASNGRSANGTAGVTKAPGTANGSGATPGNGAGTGTAARVAAPAIAPGANDELTPLRGIAGKIAE